MQNGKRLAGEREAEPSTCVWRGVGVVPGHVAQDVGLDDHGGFQHLHLPLLLQAVLQRLPQEDLRAEEQEESDTVSPFLCTTFKDAKRRMSETKCFQL